MGTEIFLGGGKEQILQGTGWNELMSQINDVKYIVDGHIVFRFYKVNDYSRPPTNIPLPARMVLILEFHALADGLALYCIYYFSRSKRELPGIIVRI